MEGGLTHVWAFKHWQGVCKRRLGSRLGKSHPHVTKCIYEMRLGSI